jgi:biopolymer transport protein TolR
MGMSTGGKPGSVKNDINVTPLVDVVLVLLIIFLVTMPTVMRTVTLEVPRKLEDFEEVATQTKPILICRLPSSIRFDAGTGDSRQIDATELPTLLEPVLKQRVGDKTVFIDFHPEVPWSAVIHTIDLVRSLAEWSKDPKLKYEGIKVALKRRDVNDDRGSGQPNGRDDADACGCRDDLKCDPEIAIEEP